MGLAHGDFAALEAGPLLGPERLQRPAGVVDRDGERLEAPVPRLLQGGGDDRLGGFEIQVGHGGSP